MNEIPFKKWIEDHTYTATELEQYAACPYSFYAGSYLGISPPPEQEPELTPAEIGRILHKTLEQAFQSKKPLMKVFLEELNRHKNRPGLVPILVEQQKNRMERMLKSFQEKEQNIMETKFF